MSRQIQEMVKLDIEESTGFYSAFINDMRISKNKPLSTSKTIMSFDCPKNYILQAIGISEDSVVLSKEEIKEKYIPKSFYELVSKVHAEKVEELENLINYWIDNWKQANKETAERYHKEMQKVIRERDYIGGYAEIGLLEENNEIAKQLSAEIEE